MTKYLQGYHKEELTPKQLRRELNLSNCEMAQMLGVRVNTWLSWQSGKRRPSAAAVRLMMVLRWLHREEQLQHYWFSCAEPAILRNAGSQLDSPDSIVE